MLKMDTTCCSELAACRLEVVQAATNGLTLEASPAGRASLMAGTIPAGVTREQALLEDNLRARIAIAAEHPLAGDIASQPKLSRARDRFSDASARVQPHVARTEIKRLGWFIAPQGRADLDLATAQAARHIDPPIHFHARMIGSQLFILFGKAFQPDFALIRLAIAVGVAQPLELAGQRDQRASFQSARPVGMSSLSAKIWAESNLPSPSLSSRMRTRPRGSG